MCIKVEIKHGATCGYPTCGDLDHINVCGCNRKTMERISEDEVYAAIINWNAENNDVSVTTVAAPDVIYRDDTHGVIQTSGYHYAWTGKIKAAYMLLNNPPFTARKALFANIVKVENDYQCLLSKINYPLPGDSFKHTFGEYRLTSNDKFVLNLEFRREYYKSLDFRKAVE